MLCTFRVCGVWILSFCHAYEAEGVSFLFFFFFFKQKTAYEMRISDWSSDVCSSDLISRSADEFSGRIEQTVGGVAAALDDTGTKIETTFGGLEGRIDRKSVV